MSGLLSGWLAVTGAITTHWAASSPVVLESVGSALLDLGPLSPLAMSPFFGVTVLSGLAQWESTTWLGPWLSDQTLVAKSPVLKHPATFWIFLALTVLTSLPRLTKVSKPLAQALDWVESYSVLLITLVIFGVGWATESADGARTLAAGLSGVGLSGAGSDAVGSAGVAQAGIVALTWGAVLMVAATINYLVVHSVRFLLELLVWLSPVPLVDALFEGLNKTLCLGLLLLYAFSPLLSLLLNIAIFAGCLWLYAWLKPRLDYHWHFWIEPWWQWWFPNYRAFDGRHLWCFAEQDFGPFRRYDRLQVYVWEGKWMMIRYDWFWRKKVHEFTHDDLPYLEATDRKVSVVLQQQIPLRLSTHRGYRRAFEQIAAGLELLTDRRLDERRARLIRAADGPTETEGDSAAAPC